MAGQARDAMAVEMLDVVADRGYYEGGEIRACEEAGITVTLPQPMTSGAKAAGRFGKQDFAYVAADDIYRCPAGEPLSYRFQCEEDGKTIRRYSTSACKTCALKAQCTTGPERRISRWEHEAVLEKVQDRLDHNPNAMGVRRQTAEHPSGTIKCWMGATHFLTKEPEVPIKVRERIGPALAPPGLVLDAQPPAQPHSGVVVDRPGTLLRRCLLRSSSPIRATCGSTCPPALWSLAKSPIGSSAHGRSRPYA